MNDAQLRALREMAQKPVAPTMRTAREMALRSHNLSRCGNRATTADGRVWTWNDKARAWYC